MTYLITQLWLCLLIAALLGFFIGWLLRGLCKCDNADDSDLQAKLDACHATVAKLEAEKSEVAAKPLAAVSAPVEEAKPSALFDAAPAKVDDLKRIKGVGVVLEKTLNDLGIYQFAQVAAFDKKTIDWIDERLKFKGRIERDEWVKQADKLKDE